MLIAVVGDFGSGKTLFLTMVAVGTKKPVLSNFWIDLPNYFSLDVVDLLDLGYNKNVFLDEAYTWLESRVSNSFLNRYISYIIFQSRHRSLDIYTTEQLFHTIDVRFRDLVHKIVKCSRVKNKRDKQEYDFKYEILNVYKNTRRVFRLKYEKALEYFPLYDTLEIIDPFNKEGLELEILKDDPQEYLKKIEEIASEIQHFAKPITHVNVKVELLRAGYGISYEPLVYAVLKKNEEVYEES